MKSLPADIFFEKVAKPTALENRVVAQVAFCGKRYGRTAHCCHLKKEHNGPHEAVSHVLHAKMDEDEVRRYKTDEYYFKWRVKPDPKTGGSDVVVLERKLKKGKWEKAGQR